MAETWYDTPTGSGSTLRAAVQLISQSQAGNSSVMRSTLQLLNVHSAAFIGSPVGCSILLGVWVDSTFTWASGGGSRNIMSTDFTVYHDANGNATIPISGFIAATGTSSIGGPTTIPGGAYVLPRIPKPASAPRSPSVAAGTGQATVSWVAPADNGGAGVTGYRVYYSLNADLSGAAFVDVGAVTSKTITGLTAGQRYYFGVAALNAAGTSPTSAIVNALLGDVPAAPAAPTVDAWGNAVEVAWVAPADNGVAIIDYTVEYSTSSTFAADVNSVVTAATRRTVAGLLPGATYYFRVKARNSIGSGAASPSSSTLTAGRGALDLVRAASVNVGKTHVSIRSDAADAPALSLGYTPFGAGTAFAPIGTVPTDAGAGTFSTAGGSRALALAADAAGNLYVIGTDAASSSSMLVKRYAKVGATSWAPEGELSQALPSTGDPLAQFAATYVPGTGASPVGSLLVFARRAGTIGVGGLSYATINLASVAASSGSLFLAYGSNPTWLAAPPVGAPHNSGLLDVAPLVAGGTRVAILADGYAVVDITNGAVVGVSKSASGSTVPGTWARVVGINATTYLALTVVGGALSWAFYGASGASLGSGSYAGGNAQGGAFAEQWDAYLNRVTGLVTVYYVADDSARKLESINVSPTTYASTAAVVVTSALGAASSVNGALRAPLGPVVDERRVLVEAANVLAGVDSTAALGDTSGNVAPSAPGLVLVDGFDASVARTFSWAFGDPNPLDTQAAYELEVQRVSDSVNVVDTGKLVGTALSHELAAGALANGVNYRWRARAWDELDTAGAWASYDAFTTSALGELTVTNPATDNPAGLDESSLTVTWAYSQGDGYVQTQRRVRVLVAAGGAVLSDTTMQASTAASYTVTDLPSDVEVIIEVSVVTNAPGTPTVTTTRNVTSSYSSPMTPELDLAAGESFVTVTVINPTPTGARPEVIRNDIERRPSGSGAPFVRVAMVEKDGVFLDYAVASRAAYDYRVKGVTE